MNRPSRLISGLWPARFLHTPEVLQNVYTLEPFEIIPQISVLFIGTAVAIKKTIPQRILNQGGA
jgi:hypothetical protein